MRNIRATIITIGDEILYGQIVDTNSPWIAKQLNEIGISIYRRTAVGDNEESILMVLEAALIASDVVIITGGLGPTSDDLTKPALCRYFGCKQVRNEDVYQHLKNYFEKRGKPMLERNAQQADLPDCCEVLFNNLGTAPGMWFNKKNKVIVSLPGVPFEMRNIMKSQVVQRLTTRFSGDVIIHKHIVTAGLGESFIAEKLTSIEKQLPEHIKVAYLPNYGIVRLRLTGMGARKDVLEKELNGFAHEICNTLAEWVISNNDKNLSEILAGILLKNKMTIAVAESCTGGLLGSRLCDVPGSGQYFLGGTLTYNNKVKEKILKVDNATLKEIGAVSESTVKQMASHVRQNFDSDISISISGILGPDDTTENEPLGTVWVGFADAHQQNAKRFQFHSDRVNNKEMAIQMALLFAINCLNGKA